jgi:hypothetical protein
MRPGTQEHVDGDSDGNKTVPFPPYVEPSVPGFDFMTGTVTEVGTSNQALPQSGDHSPLFVGVTTPTLEDAPAPMGHGSVPCSPDGHAVPHLSDTGHDFESIRPQTDDLPHLGMVQTTLGPDECSNCTNSSQASIRDIEIERLKATIDGLIKSLDQMEDERDAAIRMAHGASYELADAHQAVYIQEGEIIEAKQVLLAEQLKVAGLEEEMERRQRSFEDKLGKLREEYRKKSGECEVQQRKWTSRRSYSRRQSNACLLLTRQPRNSVVPRIWWCPRSTSTSPNRLSAASNATQTAASATTFLGAGTVLRR